jgi:Phage integrase, N-terminal SAM-like domain
VAHIERRRIQQRDASGRTRTVVHYKVCYRDATGMHHSEPKTRLVDAECRKAEIEVALATATWRDPRRGELGPAEWAQAWLPTRLDLRPTTWARLETTMQKQVLPHFGSVPLNTITNAMVREWVSTLLSSGLSAATTRKAVFALRQCLAAAIADERIQFNPACAVPLPTERQKPPRYLSQSEVERVVDQMPCQYRASSWSACTPDFAGRSFRFTQARHRPATLPYPRDIHGRPVSGAGDLGQRAQDDALEAFRPGRPLSHAAA